MIKRTSINLDLDLVGRARDILETRTATDTIHRALEDVIKQDAFRKLAEWRPDLTPEDLDRMRRPWKYPAA